MTLRTLEREDLKRLHELDSNVELVMLGNGHWAPFSLVSMEKEFDKDQEREERGDFVIEVEGRIIGSVGLHRWAERRSGTAAFGIAILDPEYVGKGYGRDALNTFLSWAFRVQNFRRIWLDAMATNTRAIRCYEACGFQREGLLRQHDYYNGALVDVVVMGLLREEWEARQAARA